MEVFAKIKAGDYTFEHEEFKGCSKEVKDLISKLIVTDTSKRLTAREALQHDWFKMQRERKLSQKPLMNKEIMGRLKDY